MMGVWSAPPAKAASAESKRVRAHGTTLSMAPGFLHPPMPRRHEEITSAPRAPRGGGPTTGSRVRGVGETGHIPPRTRVPGTARPTPHTEPGPIGPDHPGPPLPTPGPTAERGPSGAGRHGRAPRIRWPLRHDGRAPRHPAAVREPTAARAGACATADRHPTQRPETAPSPARRDSRPSPTRRPARQRPARRPTPDARRDSRAPRIRWPLRHDGSRAGCGSRPGRQASAGPQHPAAGAAAECGAPRGPGVRSRW